MRKQAKQYEAQIEELYTQIGKLTAQYEWMKKNLESNHNHLVFYRYDSDSLRV